MNNKRTWLVKTWDKEFKLMIDGGFYTFSLVGVPDELDPRKFEGKKDLFISEMTETVNHRWGKQVWSLCWEMKKGDRIVLILPKGKSKDYEYTPSDGASVVAKGTIKDDFNFNDDGKDKDGKLIKAYKIKVDWEDLSHIQTHDDSGLKTEVVYDISDRKDLLKQIGERIDEDNSESQEPEGGLRKWEDFKSPANQPLNKILSGPPGTGKTFKTLELSVKLCDQSLEKEQDRKKLESSYQGLIEQGRIEFITFHQTYDYSDFVQGIRPKEQNGGMAFEYYKGPLRRLADAAAMNYRQPGDILPYVLIIDEINRGNVSKIFGELITLIEEDKRGIHGHTRGLSVKLLYENDASKRFFLPPNLYIIGTMNTADRSVQRLDSALRRRFEFENIAPEPSLLKGDKNLEKLLEKINLRIFQELNDTGSQIGHAWFMNKGKVISEDQDILRVLNNKVIPLLIEWFWNQPDSLKKVLGNKSYNLVVKNGVNTELTEENLIEFIELS